MTKFVPGAFSSPGTSPLTVDFKTQAFLQLDMKLLRGLPCSPFASACFEQSSDFAVRTTGALVVVEVTFLVLLVVWIDVVAAAWGWACARAEPESSIAPIKTGERWTKRMVLLLGEDGTLRSLAQIVER